MGSVQLMYRCLDDQSQYKLDYTVACTHHLALCDHLDIYTYYQPGRCTYSLPKKYMHCNQEIEFAIVSFPQL